MTKGQKEQDMAHNRVNSPMLTTSDVAHLLNVHINTVRRWGNRGVIKAYRVGPRGDRRFRREDIANLLLGKSIDSIGVEENMVLTGSTLEDDNNY
jgi:excisionase family DNA binding protein